VIFDEHDLAGAVYFFSDGRDDGSPRELIRAMTYTEFEAIMNGYVPAVDLSNRELGGVYVEINNTYKIKSAVFFLVRFTSRGFIEEGWSIPLFQLAQLAAKGPNLGAGPIALACASRCPIKHLSSFLWDPDLRGGRRELRALAEAVARNGVAIEFREPDPEVKLKQQESERSRAIMEESISLELRREYDKAFRDHMAQTIRDQRLRTSTIVREHESSIAEIKQQYNARIEEYRLSLEEHKKQLELERARNHSLKETIDGQVGKIQGLREYFEVKLEQAASAEQDQLSELKDGYRVDIEVEVEAAVREYKELLQMREVEILYRNEQEAKLHQELDSLRSENHSLIENSGDHLLSSMMEKGISFVSYQPGAGHVTLPISAIPRYIESPTAYIAEHCGVSEEHYNAWLEHYHVPICRAADSAGNLCGENIGRIESPADFIYGESDCCHKHRTTKTPRLKLAGGK